MRFSRCLNPECHAVEVEIQSMVFGYVVFFFVRDDMFNIIQENIEDIYIYGVWILQKFLNILKVIIFFKYLIYNL